MSKVKQARVYIPQTGCDVIRQLRGWCARRTRLTKYVLLLEHSSPLWFIHIQATLSFTPVGFLRCSSGFIQVYICVKLPFKHFKQLLEADTSLKSTAPAPTLIRGKSLCLCFHRHCMYWNIWIKIQPYVIHTKGLNDSNGSTSDFTEQNKQ